MTLSDDGILQALANGDLTIEPLIDSSQLQPASVDLRLGNVLSWYDKNHWKPLRPEDNLSDVLQTRRYGDGEAMYIEPGQFYLATTIESVSLSSGILGRLDGRSSLGRRGIMVHSTAGFIDPGFHGPITLEMTNITHLPMVLVPGMRVCQLSLTKVTPPALRPYRGKYNGQEGPTASRLHLDEGRSGEAPQTVDQLRFRYLQWRNNGEGNG